MILRTVFILCLSFIIGAYALQIAVIANKNFPVSNLNESEIRKVFLKKKMFIKDKKVIPVNLKNNSQIRQLFQKYILKMDNEEYNLYWNEKYFNGIKPPIVMSSQEAVIKFVKNIDNAIGYVELKKVKNRKDIKILKIINVGKKNGH